MFLLCSVMFTMECLQSECKLFISIWLLTKNNRLSRKESCFIFSVSHPCGHFLDDFSGFCSLCSVLSFLFRQIQTFFYSCCIFAEICFVLHTRFYYQIQVSLYGIFPVACQNTVYPEYPSLKRQLLSLTAP